MGRWGFKALRLEGFGGCRVLAVKPADSCKFLTALRLEGFGDRRVWGCRGFGAHTRAIQASSRSVE